MLYVVATPIGNLEDLSKRAGRILSEVDVIAAEDTRRTGLLLKHLSLQTAMIAMHDHNEKQLASELVERMQAGQQVALVSDAGTPLISDPGFQLVAQCHHAGIQVVPVAGPSSVIAALSAAGIATDRFSFEGFVPAKSKARRDFFRSLLSEQRSMVFFEVPHRIEASLADLQGLVGGERMLTVCRELTKAFEQVVSAEVDLICSMLASGDIPAKGEFVLVLSGATGGYDRDTDELLVTLMTELSPSKAASLAAELTGRKKSELYARAVELKDLL